MSPVWEETQAAVQPGHLPGIAHLNAQPFTEFTYQNPQRFTRIKHAHGCFNRGFYLD